MPSVLDQRMDAVVAGLTGPGGPMALTTATRDGIEYPVIAAAPPALSYYFAHFCAEHADKEFLVADQERLTFAQVHAAASDVARGSPLPSSRGRDNAAMSGYYKTRRLAKCTSSDST